MICLHSFMTKRKLRNHKNFYEENNKTVKYNHGEKSMKAPFVIYADLECLLQKWKLVIKILKSHQQIKKINMHQLVIHCLHIVHLM